MKSLASVDVLSETRGRLRCLEAGDRALWGRMSAREMARHLSCAYEVALGEREVAPLKVLSPMLMKWGGLRSGLRWPKNLATTPELELALKEESAATFEDSVELAVANMEAVASSAKLAPRHPMFGPMSGADWMRWGYLHADHHLRQFGR
jgi:Protein of unknown function (DUF1569)